MTAAVIATFVIGYLAIVFEHPLKLDKTVPALIMAAVAWALIALGQPELYHIVDGHEHTIGTNEALLHHIGKVAEILVFLIGAMTIIELIDMHKGFSVITDMIKTRDKKSLLWLITWITFFLSAVLDNLTCTIVMVSLIKKMLNDREEKLYFASLIVIAANAGGAWSPIGDVTTTMLWNANQVSSMALIATLFVPSVVCTLVPTFLLTRLPIMQGEVAGVSTQSTTEQTDKQRLGAKIMLYVGIGGLIFVPVFKTITHLSPYVGMMLALGIVWLVSERIHPDEDLEEGHATGAKHALSRIDTSSILFFLGILLTVAGLESMNILKNFAAQLDSVFPQGDSSAFATGRDIIMVLLGYGSAIVDNVPLVAAAQGMYGSVAMDDKMWHLLAYTAGTGGSMLIIGSAAGVAAMGMEQIDFMWYFRKISLITMLGFLAGIAVFLAMYPFVSPLVVDAAAATVVPAEH